MYFRYLTLKFKEMEEQFRKNKNKQTAEDKIDSEEEKNESGEDNVTTEATDINDRSSSEKSYVSAAHIVVESPGMSGNVERLAI